MFLKIIYTLTLFTDSSESEFAAAFLKFGKNVMLFFSLPSILLMKLAVSRNFSGIPLFGLGCMAGVAGWTRVHDDLQA